VATAKTTQTSVGEQRRERTVMGLTRIGTAAAA